VGDALTAGQLLAPRLLVRIDEKRTGAHVSDDWDFYLCRVADRPASIDLDLGLARKAPIDARRKADRLRFASGETVMSVLRRAVLAGLVSAMAPAFAESPPRAPASASTEALVRKLEAASTKPLPDADTVGAKLVSTYCAQCHGTPQPFLHTADEWVSLAQRMHELMDKGWGIKSPTKQEMTTIVAYLQKHARQ
jgi:cytochrome c5